MVQTWNQANEMLLTSQSKRQSVILMDTETGTTKSELSLRRGRRGCDLNVESITPMQKFEQYKPSQEYKLFGIGDEGKTVFGMNHDSAWARMSKSSSLKRTHVASTSRRISPSLATPRPRGAFWRSAALTGQWLSMTPS